MSRQRISQALVMSAANLALSPVRLLAANDGAGPIEQRKPEFPKKELVRGREGWVILRYSISDDGLVIDPSIEESSGSDAFDQAALEAVQGWRYEPSVEKTDNVLLSFIYERKQPSVSRKFYSGNQKLHNAIDRGEYEEAQASIYKMRSDDDLSTFELAYSYIAEGRIYGEKGDKSGQLRCFRRALLNEGRWLPRDDYLKLLHATAILELQLNDFSSAIRDYALLNETAPGRELGASLREPMLTVETMVAERADPDPPYMAANMEVLIRREGRRTGARDPMANPSSDNEPPPRPTAEPAEPSR